MDIVISRKLIDETMYFKKKPTLWPLFMDGTQLPQG